jgi:hypothetical protein
MGMFDEMKGLLSEYTPSLLPDDPNKNAAARQGLLAFGAAMLGGKGHFSGILGDGLLAGSQGYQGALQQQQKDQMEAAQLKLLQNKDTRDQNMSSFVSDRFGVSGKSISDAAAGTSAAPMSAGFPSSVGVGSRPEFDWAGSPSMRSLSSLPKLNSSGAPDQRPTPVPPGQAGRMAQQTPQRQSQGGQFPLTLNDVAALKAMGGPDMMDAYKFSQEGVQRQQGSTYSMPDGTEQSYARLDPGQVQGRDGAVSNAPGYLDAFSAAERAKADASEGAKADYDVLDPTKFISADGRPVASTRGAYVRSIGDLPKVGQPPRVSGAPSPVQPGRAVSGAQFPVVTPQEQRARDGDRLSILQDELRNTRNPADIAALQREIASTRRNVGAGNGGRGAPILQSPVEARAQMGAVDTNVKAGQDLNSNWIKEIHNPVQAEGKAARATLSQIQTLQNIDFKSGWGAEAKAGAANLLATLGVKDAAQYAGNAQKFQQVAMERNMTMLQTQAGPQTDGDSQRAQQTFVRLANTPAANQYIADLTAANARISLQKAEYYNRALPLAKQRGDMTEIDRRWSKIAPSVWSDPGLAKYLGKK